MCSGTTHHSSICINGISRCCAVCQGYQSDQSWHQRIALVTCNDKRWNQATLLLVHDVLCASEGEQVQTSLAGIRCILGAGVAS